LRSSAIIFRVSAESPPYPDLHAVSMARPDLETCVVAMTNTGCTYDYPPAVRFQIHEG
jgi:hypothetical protein